jgi:hypothetical protein
MKARGVVAIPSPLNGERARVRGEAVRGIGLWPAGFSLRALVKRCGCGSGDPRSASFVALGNVSRQLKYRGALSPLRRKAWQPGEAWLAIS